MCLRNDSRKNTKRAGFLFLSLKNDYGFALITDYTKKIEKRLVGFNKIRSSGIDNPSLEELEETTQDIVFLLQ